MCDEGSLGPRSRVARVVVFKPAIFFAFFAGGTLFIAAVWRISGGERFANSPNARRREAARVARLGSRVWFVIGITSAVVALVLLLVELAS
jgi:hypothetical protein